MFSPEKRFACLDVKMPQQKKGTTEAVPPTKN
jgi:hypothetical protein